MGECMKRLYGKLVRDIVAIGLIAGCDSAMKSVKEKEICKTEECVETGDNKLQKVYKKIAFFYQFPELVKMGAEVLSRLYDVSKTIEQQSGH